MSHPPHLDFTTSSYLTLSLLPTIPPRSILHSLHSPPPLIQSLLYHGKVGSLQHSHLYELPGYPTTQEPSPELLAVRDWLASLEGVTDVQLEQPKQRVKRGGHF